MGNKFIKTLSGMFFGTISGLVSTAFVAGAYVGFPSFIKENSIPGAIFVTIVMTLFFLFLFGPTAASIGAFVGAVNGATNGGIGAGIEWIIIASCASIFGAWLWKIDIDSYLWYGILGGITGGIVGWITWFSFRVRGARNKLTVSMLVGYLFAFTYIAVLSPLFTQFMFFIFDD